MFTPVFIIVGFLNTENLAGYPDLMGEDFQNLFYVAVQRVGERSVNFDGVFIISFYSLFSTVCRFARLAEIHAMSAGSRPAKVATEHQTHRPTRVVQAVVVVLAEEPV